MSSSDSSYEVQSAETVLIWSALTFNWIRYIPVICPVVVVVVLIVFGCRTTVSPSADATVRANDLLNSPGVDYSAIWNFI